MGVDAIIRSVPETIATRAVVLARGLGTRMRAVAKDAALTDQQKHAADAGMKAMMPVGDRPFLDFVLSVLADGGILQVAVVVAPEHDTLRKYYTVSAPSARVRIDFVVQDSPLGTADAVLSAASWVQDEPFLVINGDNLYPGDVIRTIVSAEGPALIGFEREGLVDGNIESSRINAFALIETDDEGYLTRIVEKPEAGEVSPRALVSMNCWRFDSRIFGACRNLPRSPRGEYELPLAVARAVERGVRFKVLPVRRPVLDLSQRADAAEVSRRLAEVTPHP